MSTRTECLLYYRTEIWPDLFDCALLLLQWGEPELKVVIVLISSLGLGAALERQGKRP